MQILLYELHIFIHINIQIIETIILYKKLHVNMYLY
jgi:hypothetical protein